MDEDAIARHHTGAVQGAGPPDAPPAAVRPRPGRGDHQPARRDAGQQQGERGASPEGARRTRAWSSPRERATCAAAPSSTTGAPSSACSTTTPAASPRSRSARLPRRSPPREPSPFLMLRTLRLTPEHADRITATLRDLAERGRRRQRPAPLRLAARPVQTGAGSFAGRLRSRPGRPDRYGRAGGFRRAQCVVRSSGHAVMSRWRSTTAPASSATRA